MSNSLPGFSKLAEKMLLGIGPSAYDKVLPAANQRLSNLIGEKTMKISGGGDLSFLDTDAQQTMSAYGLDSVLGKSAGVGAMGASIPSLTGSASANASQYAQQVNQAVRGVQDEFADYLPQTGLSATAGGSDLAGLDFADGASDSETADLNGFDPSNIADLLKEKGFSLGAPAASTGATGTGATLAPLAVRLQPVAQKFKAMQQSLGPQEQQVFMQTLLAHPAVKAGLSNPETAPVLAQLLGLSQG